MSVPGWLKVWYKKPEWRDINDYTRMVNDESLIPRHRPRSPTPAFASIPSRLSLDRVLENKTCSPMSLHDFYLYLKHIEHSSENLEFYLWAHSAETDLSSVVSIYRNLERRIAHLESPCIQAAKDRSIWSMFVPYWLRRQNHADCADGFCRLEAINESGDIERNAPSPDPSPVFGRPSSSKSSIKENRAELDSAIATFLVPGGEKELNISHVLRQRVLQQLEQSSDPRHLRPVADHIYEVMKNCSHRNFVNVGVSTGTYETICVGNLIGILFIIAGLLVVLLQAFHPYRGAHTRWTCFYVFPLWQMGVTLLLVGTQGMCMVMLSMSKRQALPWERFDDGASVVADSSGPQGWLGKYRKFMDKTVAHDRKFKVEDKHLRRLQRMILFQCGTAGVIAGLLGVLLFIFLPIWKETYHHHH
ncbi:hypothetical protein M406DRAFT_327028 [Cryphonectria parasitica EP155]|uniref:RGS domain-containing protein n=1 Tax=Cryphonectria parasitica (strain ATCC 38755 / EP155) TaxID=660469 RepID=A0A9P4Y8B8_CRYP1|nr:uncharacterized protein M406DRAFT_327028 [Cryphonectria parasitica EP155]KAF3768601.1 hypothetical protein M406DRAFT_327028 [Cryphonectria parasitica EP155]